MRIRVKNSFYSHLRSVKSNTFCSHAAVNWIKPEGNATGFSIYNPITKTKVPFITKSSDFISWYICGPTVYDSAHIGHACTYLRFDIIRRILEKYLNANIIQVMCITDIDDKIIKRAQELNTDWAVLSKAYENEFFNDLTSLSIRKPTIVSRATDFIPQMIKFIQNLIDKDVAYSAPDGSVYFSLEKFGKPGKFRQPNSSAFEISENEFCNDKKNSSDFALWKGSKPNEPFWEAPWGRGRPGWHIECSTIASEHFGNNVDLHSGALDLIFPHHQNEESQCCAFHDTDQWVNYWLHTGHLHYNNDKMSKSLKNTISIREYLSTNSPNHLRMLCLYTNYRNFVEFDGEEVTYSIRMCTKFYEFFDECRAYVNSATNKGNVDQVRLLQILQETKEKVSVALMDDFDTKSCICSLSDLIAETRGMLNAKQDVDVTKCAENIDDIINSSVTFRSKIRELALSTRNAENDELKTRCKDLLKMCDDFRAMCYQHGIIIKDRKNDTATWSYVKAVKNETRE